MLNDMQDAEAEFSIKAKDGSAEITISGDDIALIASMVAALEHEDIRELWQTAFEIANKPIYTNSPQEKEYLS